MEQLNIHIVEDEKLIGESLQEILDCLGHSTVAISTSAEEALEVLSKNSPDLILLDIQIKGDKDGVELAGIIQKKYDIPFIFTTAFADSATIERAKEQSPYGYVVKPYGLKDIQVAIEIAMNNFEKFQEMKSTDSEALAANKNLYLKVDYRLVKVDEEDILWIEAKGDYAVFKTKTKSYVVHTTLRNVEEKLTQSRFLKVHRSFIVNMDHVVDIEDSNLLIEKKIIPVSRANKEALMSRIQMI
ncbi:MAG: LytTR family transcriptional regulator DNA-binding domain-containing protein [Bacteroidota bacterium]